MNIKLYSIILKLLHLFSFMDIEQKVEQTLKKIRLKKKEKILVAISGGKDSAVTAYLLKRLGYKIKGIHIDLGLGKYSENCLKSVKELCNKLKIKLYLYSVKKETGKTMSDIFKHKDEKLSNCTLCGVMKKWLLNKKSRELKADKIATGHNFNDGLETFLMNLFKGSQNSNLNSVPILKTKNKKFIVRIKPLFFIANGKIENYCKKLNLPVYKKICPYRGETYRVETRDFVKKLSDKEKKNLMKNFLELAEKIKKDEKETRYCEVCGEPSRKNLCKRCELLNSKI